MQWNIWEGKDRESWLFNLTVFLGGVVCNLCIDFRLHSHIMSFISPFANLQVMLLNDRHTLPWITTEKLVYESPLTGEEYEVPKHFRTDLVSVPKALAALPWVGSVVLLKFFGTGVWKGAREGALHDYLRREDRWGNLPVPPIVAHRVFREALYAANYDPELCELYYRAVSTFNS